MTSSKYITSADKVNDRSKIMKILISIMFYKIIIMMYKVKNSEIEG